MDPRTIAEDLGHDARLDKAVGRLTTVADRALPDGELKLTLQGKHLGHPLHPVLTDLTIGFWTSAWVLDLVGGRRSRPAADAFVGLGVACAVPTAASGLADWTGVSRPKQRVGVVHAASNLLATVLYLASFLHRRRGHRLRGVALGMAGAAAATAGGYLGGHLAFGDSDDALAEAGADDAGAEPRYVPPGPLHRVS